MDYSRQQKLNFISDAEQQKLANSRVLVFGAGGLGCAALPFLATAGVGHITVVDADEIASHNLHRQLLFSQQDIGKNKALQSVKRLQQLNTIGDFKSISCFLGASELVEILPSYDVCLDCTDDNSFSLMLNSLALKLNKPVIFANASRMQGQLFNFSGDLHDACLACLWGDAVQLTESCDGVGVLGPVPGILGNMQAIEAIKFIIAHEDVPPMRNSLLHIDFTNYQNQLLTVILDENCSHHGNANNLSLINENTMQDLEETFNQSLAIAIEEGFTVIDICNIGERPQPLPVKHLQIPLETLATQTEDHIDATTPYLLVCMSGNRSRKLQQFLKTQKRYTNFSAFVGVL